MQRAAFDQVAGQVVVVVDVRPCRPESHAPCANVARKCAHFHHPIDASISQEAVWACETSSVAALACGKQGIVLVLQAVC